MKLTSKSTLKRHKHQLDTSLAGMANVSEISHSSTHVNALITLTGSEDNPDTLRINYCLCNKMYIIDIICNQIPAKPSLRLGLANISFISKLLTAIEKLDKRSIIVKECLSIFDTWAKRNTCL